MISMVVVLVAINIVVLPYQLQLTAVAPYLVSVFLIVVDIGIERLRIIFTGYLKILVAFLY